MVLRVRVRQIETLVVVSFKPVGPALAWPKVRARIERRIYKNGLHRIKTKVAGVPLPDGTKLQVTIEGRPLIRWVLRGGRSKSDLESKHAEHIPRLDVGEKLTVTHEGETVLEGVAELG